MIISNCSVENLHTALDAINSEIYEGNIRFKDISPLSPKRIRFTLTVNDSKGPGGRISPSGRAVSAACWHVHGYFFESIFDICPNAVIRAGDKTITKDSGNWQDWNIGSQMQPFYYSEACNCAENGID